MVTMSSRRGPMPKPQLNRTEETRSESEQGALSCVLSRNLIPVLIFVFTLFFIMTFSNPALFLNDEWITVNQLHQLGEGHQVIVNEGKYGTFLNGTPGPYFQERYNLLGYTLMLPILSLPALWFFGLFGDQFRLAIVLLWSLLPVTMAVLVDAYRPQYAQWRGVRWAWFVIGAAFLALLANFALYYPWPFTAPDAPVETAAVVFTNHLIFAAFAVMMYLICRTLFEDTWFSIFGTIACISCSSYIFWASNAKDHILTAALVAAVILFMVRYIQYGGFRDAAIGFAFIGLLAWARPELGLTVFLFTVVYYVIYQVRGIHRSPDHVSLIRSFTIPIFTLVGTIPLFCNNLYVTGSPLIPTLYVYEKQLPKIACPDVGQMSTDAIENVSQSVPANGLDGFLRVITHNFSLQFATLPSDIFGLLFTPESGNMSLVAVSPLIVIALIALPFLIWKKSERFSLTDRWFILFLITVSVAIWAGYLRLIHGLNTSQGIVPDIRYLAPIYLPTGLLGVYAIWRLNGDADPKRRALWQMAVIGVVAPVLLVALMLIQPYGGQYAGYTQFFTQTTFVLLAATLILIAVRKRFGLPNAWITVALLLLIAIPFAWQLMMVFLYSVAKFNGYPLWIPLVETFFQHYIGVLD